MEQNNNQPENQQSFGSAKDMQALNDFKEQSAAAMASKNIQEANHLAAKEATEAANEMNDDIIKSKDVPFTPEAPAAPATPTVVIDSVPGKER